MCLLLHKPEGIGIPERLIEAAGQDNPDGWGIMRSDGKRLHITRGMRPGKIRDAIRAVGSAECVVHWRMATHGAVGLENCHPFEFRAGGRNYALAHNGIIASTVAPIRDRKRSDTWHFAHDVVRPALHRTPNLHGDSAWRDALADAVGTHNKLAILRADGKLDLINREQGIEWEGLWLSNGYSIPDRIRTRAHVGSAWRSNLMEWDSAAETWQDAERMAQDAAGWGDDLETLGAMAEEDIADLCQNDPYYVAQLIADYFAPKRGAGWRR